MNQETKEEIEIRCYNEFDAQMKMRIDWIVEKVQQFLDRAVQQVELNPEYTNAQHILKMVECVKEIGCDKVVKQLYNQKKFEFKL